MMSDDADDVDADGADDNVGDNDGVFFSPELAQDNGLAENKTRPRGHRKRHPGPPPEAGTPGHAFTVGPPLPGPLQRPTQHVRGLLRELLQDETAGPPQEAPGATARGRYTWPRLHHGAAAAQAL